MDTTTLLAELEDEAKATRRLLRYGPTADEKPVGGSPAAR